MKLIKSKFNNNLYKKEERIESIYIQKYKINKIIIIIIKRENE